MLNDLKKLVIAQKTAVLPTEAPDPALAALHTALTQYDQLVSQVVIQAIQGLPFDFPTKQEQALISELDELFAGAPGGRDVENYRRYRQRLDQMSELAQQAASNRP